MRKKHLKAENKVLRRLMAARFSSPSQFRAFELGALRRRDPQEASLEAMICLAGALAVDDHRQRVAFLEAALERLKHQLRRERNANPAAISREVVQHIKQLAAAQRRAQDAEDEVQRLRRLLYDSIEIRVGPCE